MTVIDVEWTEHVSEVEWTEQVRASNTWQEVPPTVTWRTLVSAGAASAPSAVGPTLPLSAAASLTSLLDTLARIEDPTVKVKGVQLAPSLVPAGMHDTNEAGFIGNGARGFGTSGISWLRFQQGAKLSTFSGYLARRGIMLESVSTEPVITPPPGPWSMYLDDDAYVMSPNAPFFHVQAGVTALVRCNTGSGFQREVDAPAGAVLRCDSGGTAYLAMSVGNTVMSDNTLEGDGLIILALISPSGGVTNPWGGRVGLVHENASNLIIAVFADAKGVRVVPPEGMGSDTVEALIHEMWEALGGIGEPWRVLLSTPYDSDFELGPEIEVALVDCSDGDVVVSAGDPESWVGREIIIDRVDDDGARTLTLPFLVSGEANPTLPPNSSATLYNNGLDIVWHVDPRRSGGGAVDSVNGHIGEVVLGAADVGAATTAQGALAATAIQPGPATTSGRAAEWTSDGKLTAAPLTGNGGRPKLDSDGTWPDALHPASIARNSEVTTAITAHSAASDPHGDRDYADDQIVAHTAATDPHGDRAYADAAIVTALANYIIPGAPGVLDTWIEMVTAIQTDQTGLAALATVVSGKLAKASNLSDLPDAAIARSNLGLGTAATHAHSDYATAAQGTDARTPTAHATSHAAAGSDALTLSQSQVTGLVTDLAAKAGKISFRSATPSGAAANYGLPFVTFQGLGTNRMLGLGNRWYEPFPALWPISIVSIGCDIRTAIAASNVRMHLWALDATGQPTGSPLMDSGATGLSSATTGRRTYTPGTPYALSTPGWYALSIEADTTGVGVTSCQPFSMLGADLNAAALGNSNTAVGGEWRAAGVTYGSTTPAPWTHVSNAANVSSNWPMLFMQWT